MNTSMPDQRQVRLNRIKLLILFAVPLSLMATAWVVYLLVQQGAISLGSTNKGVLIQPPRQLQDITVLASDGTPVEFAGQEKWSMLIPGRADCDKACREVLWVTRQVHVRLDKDANHIRRYYLNTDDHLSEDLAAHLAQEHHYLQVINATQAQLQQLFAGTNVPGDMIGRHLFMLVDPQGWVMMYYTPQHSGGDILKDIKHLLKFSVEQ